MSTYIDYPAIRAAHSLAEYYRSRGGKLRKTRRGWVGKCILHNESKGEAFFINEATQRWQCRGKCNCWGDIFDLIARLDGVSREEAARLLSNNLVQPVSRRSRPKSASAQQKTIRAPKTELLKRERDRFANAVSRLLLGHTVLDDIADERGLKVGTLRRLASEGDLGLEENFGKATLLFRYPCTIKLRIAKPDGTRDYAYDGGDALGHCYRGDRISASTNEVVIFEGEPDVLSGIDAELELDGHTICVGLSTANIGPNFVVEPFKGKRVIICLDRDKAGAEATQTLTARLSGHAAQIIIREITCPDSKDFSELHQRFGARASEYTLDREFVPKTDKQVKAAFPTQLFVAVTGAGKETTWAVAQSNPNEKTSGAGDTSLLTVKEYTLRKRIYTVGSKAKPVPDCKQAKSSEVSGRKLKREILGKYSILSPEERPKALKNLVQELAPKVSEQFLDQVLAEQYQRTKTLLDVSELEHISEGLANFVNWNSKFPRSKTLNAKDRQDWQMLPKNRPDSWIWERSFQLVHGVARNARHKGKSHFFLSGDQLAFRLGVPPTANRYRVGSEILRVFCDWGIIRRVSGSNSVAGLACSYSWISLEPLGEIESDPPF